MVIFGSGKANLTNEVLPNCICPHCETKGQMQLHLYRSHAHIFWIPIFPMKKKGVAECQHCKKAFEPKQFSEEMEKEYGKIKSDASGPIWQFAGLGVIAGLLIWGSILSKQDKADEQKYLAEPLSGDRYHVVVSPGNYSTLKVIEVSKDSVFVVQNNYEISKRTKISKIDKPENYTESPFGISKEQVAKMYEEKDIYDIRR